MSQDDLARASQKVLQNAQSIRERWPEVYIESTQTSLDVVDRLDRYGIAVFHDPFSSNSMSRIDLEFESIMEGGFEVISDHVTGDVAFRARRIEPTQLSQVNCPAIHNLFSNNFITEIAEEYLEGPKMINDVLYAVTNYGTQSPFGDYPFLMHFDAINSLKFFLYLDNSNSDNGPFMCLPRGHKSMREKREIEIAKNLSYSEIDTSAEVNLEEVVWVDGPPGTFFVFDTDIPHTAGWVKHGGRRRILRNGSYTSKELERQKIAIAKDGVGPEHGPG